MNPVRKCHDCPICKTNTACFFANLGGGLSHYRCVKCGHRFEGESPRPLIGGVS